MRDWRYVPELALREVYKSLGRRDRLSCTLVCPQWRNAMDYVGLWRKMTVHIDSDFTEPSTIFLTRYYHKYLQSLDLSWATPALSQSKWSHLRYDDLTKKVGRYLIILYDSYVQLSHLKISDWYNIFHMRKLSYFLIRFIKYQHNLRTLHLSNANFYAIDFSKILASCMNSSTCLVELNVRYSSAYAKKRFDGWIFASCLETFVSLRELTVDYWIFCDFAVKVQTENHNFVKAKIILNENEGASENLPEITSENWSNMRKIFPNLTVHLLIDRALKFDEIDLILKPQMPLTHFSSRLFFEDVQDDSYEYKQALKLLADRFKKTIESVKLEIDLDSKRLTREIHYILFRCKKLKSLRYNCEELMTGRILLLR
ncbi:F-box only protein 39-like isoform X2 [Cylas formicarius]|uniref:F-box only protein 39-like isoform X2 n=1 Tax=Cylas formicarius TaxID=197179 RepID=UPI002958D80C|nr:F-box only protein 39-like isoform X2 [Cylas formicarius]